MEENPKKVLTPEDHARLLAGRVAAKKRRVDIKISQESKADTLEVIKKIQDDANIQLEAVKDDVVTIHKMMVQMDRAIIAEDWGRVSSIAAAIHAFGLNISRRVETAAAQATVANRILAVIRVNEDA
jgi:prophage DNA circulation protein